MKRFFTSIEFWLLGSSICRNSQKLDAKVVPLPPVNPITPTDFYSPWRLEKSGIHCSYSTTKFCCSHLILAYTVRLAMINVTELERNSCFSLSLWTKSLQIELVTKYDTNDFFKESLVGVGPNLRRVSISAGGFGRGGSGFGPGSKSAEGPN